MDNKHFFVNTVEWNEALSGRLHADDFPSIDVASPPIFPGGKGGMWTPEDMFVAASNICLMSTFVAIATMSKLNFAAYSSEATGTLEKVDGTYMMSKIEIRPKITVEKETDVERAERLIQKAKKSCLISNSIKSETILNPEITIQQQ
jgi:peroxiredoxin-like protein